MKITSRGGVARRIRGATSGRAWLWLLCCLPSACSRGGGADTAAAGVVQAARSEPDATLLHFEGRFGDPDALWGEASYKVKRVSGKRVRHLELDVVSAPPSVPQALTLDGFDLGTVRANRKGSLEFEISEEDEQLFPSGFREPHVGSIFRVGELMELRLDDLVKLTRLEAPITGPGALSGKVGFKVERLGSTVTREFQVKVEKAPIKTVHPVTLDGVYVGDLVIDVEGAGKLKFSTKERPPFPADFPEPRPDSQVQVGELFSGKLQDTLAQPAE